MIQLALSYQHLFEQYSVSIKLFYDENIANGFSKKKLTLPQPIFKPTEDCDSAVVFQLLLERGLAPEHLLATLSLRRSTPDEKGMYRSVTEQNSLAMHAGRNSPKRPRSHSSCNSYIAANTSL